MKNKSDPLLDGQWGQAGKMERYFNFLREGFFLEVGGGRRMKRKIRKSSRMKPSLGRSSSWRLEEGGRWMGEEATAPGGNLP